VRAFFMPKKVILCVDDEKYVLDALRDQLSNYFGNQYQYELAESAEDALELIDELSEENVEVIVIISDWLMPQMKGDDFLIAVHQKFPKIIKIMLTGQADDNAIKRAKKEANLLISIRKPWNVERLIKAIQESVENL